ncbi:MAG TPA: HAMP domain-containing methyl-accepting chemotaxis protein [Thermoanaerobaculia bacterium]|nr:HAMP domain-containing methyl-accepting chemotaxis protein [Thermoanaerobaculia bacterium]
MRLAHKYALAIVAPPLFVFLPLALVFLARVTRMPLRTAITVSSVALVGYIFGGLLAAATITRAAGRVESDLAAGRDPSDAVSSALAMTTLASTILWIGWGLIASMAGAALIDRSFLGLQYFAETALIVAAPAMAWTYWAGKRMLLEAARDAKQIAYTGRTWSVGLKIAMVFIGFFIVSAGALVLVTASYVAAHLGEDVAYEIARVSLPIALITTIIFGVATWFLAHDVTAPMQELVRLAEEMALGQFAIEPRIFADDEVGKLAKSFGTTRTKLRALLGTVGTRGGSITDGVRMMSAGTESLVDNAHEQTGMAAQSTDALSTVRNEAQSVLREVDRVAELTYDSAGRATELRASFAEVATRMDDLFQSVEKSSSAATEIDAAARETANRTMNLAGIGGDVLAFVAEMDATVEQIMRTAQSTAVLSDQVRENAAAGRTAVEATVSGIRTAQESTRRTAGAFDELQRSLGKIDQILLFIDEVTNRTNLLALNAAIIAAHAGKDDHGFSVIADEVRQLADRTRTATKEIAGIIRSVQPIARQAVEALEEGVQNVDTTVDLARNAANALAEILGSADRSLEMTHSISRSLEEQAKASRHLHGVTAKMSDHISEMHRATQGQAEATRMLAMEAERVRDIALQVKRATEEQTATGDGIAGAMEQIANDVRTIRDRLDRQLHQAEQIATASRLTLTIAERNNTIAEQFRNSLQTLLHAGKDFDVEVARFRV